MHRPSRETSVMERKHGRGNHDNYPAKYEDETDDAPTTATTTARVVLEARQLGLRKSLNTCSSSTCMSATGSKADFKMARAHVCL